MCIENNNQILITVESHVMLNANVGLTLPYVGLTLPYTAYIARWLSCAESQATALTAIEVVNPERAVFTH